MKSDTSDPQVVSVMSPPQQIDLEYSPKHISIEKKTKTPKIFQKLLQRKSVDHAIPPSASPTLSLTSSGFGVTQGTTTLVQSQQEYGPPLSPGKTRRRTLFKHGQGASSSILTSSSSSSSTHSSKHNITNSRNFYALSFPIGFPCGYECGILRLGVLIVKSKYLYFEENPNLYNLLSKYGYSEHEAVVSDPVYNNSPIDKDKDIFPLKIPFSSIIGISKNVNDFSYEINVYTSTETTHTIVFEDINAYQNAHLQIEKVMAHKRHSAFSLVRRSIKTESASIADDDSHVHRQRNASNDVKQSDLRYGQQIECVGTSGSPPPMYYPPQGDDGSYESDGVVLETSTRKKRKKHKKKKERKSEFDEFPANDSNTCNDESGVDATYKKNVDDDDEEDEEEDYVDDLGNNNTNSMCTEGNAHGNTSSNSPDLRAIKDNGALIEKKDNGEENNSNSDNIDKKGEEEGQRDGNNEGKEKKDDKEKRRKRRREKEREKMIASNRHRNEYGFVTNAVYFILGVIATVLVQHIF